MSVGGLHLVIPLKLPQCNISCQKSMSVGVSNLVFHLKLPQHNISCHAEVYVGWWLTLSNYSPKTMFLNVIFLARSLCQLVAGT